MSRVQSSIGAAQNYGPRQDAAGLSNTVSTYGPFKLVEVDFDWEDANAGLPTLNADVDAAVDVIPAGSAITRAYVQVGTDWASTGSATLELGLQEVDGDAISAAGIDSIAVAALTPGAVIVCDGALIGAVSSATLDAQISIDDATEVFTAGTAKLVVEYLPPYGA